MAAHLVLLILIWDTLIHPRDNQEGYDCITKVSQNINLPACKYFFMQCIARHDLSSNSCDSMYWIEISRIKIFQTDSESFLGLQRMPSSKCFILVTRGGFPVCHGSTNDPTIWDLDVSRWPGSTTKNDGFLQVVPGMGQMPPESRGKFHSSLACRTGYWWHCCSTSVQSWKLLHP